MTDDIERLKSKRLSDSRGGATVRVTSVIIRGKRYTQARDDKGRIITQIKGTKKDFFDKYTIERTKNTVSFYSDTPLEPLKKRLPKRESMLRRGKTLSYVAVIDTPTGEEYITSIPFNQRSSSRYAVDDLNNKLKGYGLNRADIKSVKVREITHVR